MYNKKRIENVTYENLQYACGNFASIVKNIEYFEQNHKGIMKLPTELMILATTGYYTSLAMLIRNNQGMDYKKIFDIWEKSLEETKAYEEENKGLKQNISVLREWEKSLEYEMEHILNLRNKFFAHIDFVEEDFFINEIINKDESKQNDLVKFFRSMIEVNNDYCNAIEQANLD